MSRSARAALRQTGDATSGFSLYPFLAVLICTMGTLILLLVIIARQSQKQAVAEHAAESAAAAQAAESELAALRGSIKQLEEARRRADAGVAQWRLALGQIEDHARTLARHLEHLRGRGEALEAGADDGQRQLLEAELARVGRDVAEARQMLEEERGRIGQQRPSYAIVPYEGPNGTRRRPIYIECRSDAVILQPEGVVLGESDFDGPLGAGNPLDAALRAEREYLLTQGQFEAGKDEPYPLFLVRPGGIAAYYIARQAIVSWAAEFGYELVDDDWQLAFPAPDPILASSLEQVVATARARQERLAAAAPAHFRDGGGGKYRVGANGGLVRIDGGGPAGSGGSGNYRSARASGRFARQQDDAPAGAADGTSSGQRAPGTATAEKLATPPAGHVAGRPHDEPAAGASSDATGAGPRPGEWVPKPPHEAQADRKPEPNKNEPPARCLADERGQNWGLRNGSPGAVPVTRPIRIDCHEDRLVIVREDGASGAVVRLGPQMETAIDEFVAGVWDEMDAWGIAGKGMYWRPILNVRVAPGAERRYEQLEALLRDSGLELQRASGGGLERPRDAIPAAARPNRLS